MPKTKFELSPLESRKQLLLAESEANRMQLSEEWRSLQGAVSGLAHQARSGITLASGASLLVAGWAAFRRFRRARHPHPSWISTLINGARTGASLWLAHRSRSR
jgi:hypothetical protein